MLLFNPPYVVTPSEEVGGGGIEARGRAARTGARCHRLLPRVADALAPGGMFLCILLTQNKPEEVMEIMRRDGLTAELYSRCRADEEELFVMRCRKPTNGDDEGARERRIGSQDHGHRKKV